MKNIPDFPKWLLILQYYGASKTTIQVFCMFYTDSEDFCSGATLIFRKFAGRIARPHIQRALTWLAAKERQILISTGEIRRNKRGKGTPVYRLNTNLLSIADGELSQFNTRRKSNNVPKDNVPDSIDSAVGKPLDNVPKNES